MRYATTRDATKRDATKRRATTSIACAALLLAAACGGSDDTSGGTAAPTDPPATEPAATDPPATDPPATEPPATDPPATDPPPPTDPPATDPPATSPPTTEPPREIVAVGLTPLPGSQLDFNGQPVANPSLVWSLYSGSGGIIVENVGGPLPPGCHGGSFFDPVTLDLLRIDGAEAEAYATRGEGGCDGIQQGLAGVVDGPAVQVNTDDLIIFDFGALPAPPFEVSTQVVNPEGNNGVFRSADPSAQLPVNDISGADFIVGADVVIEVSGPDLVVRATPPPAPGDCTPFFNCLGDRFGVDLIDATGSPGGVSIGGDDAGLFYFSSMNDWEALVRVLNGCEINDHFWVFAAATTNVEYELTVTDTLSADVKTYPPLSTFEPILDTQAFATCP